MRKMSNMRRNDLARKIACWITLGALSLQPSLSFAADIVADASAPEAQRPYVTETASGVPLVQIARPDGGDVSVNRYEAFSVPERGAILNNAFLFSKNLPPPSTWKGVSLKEIIKAAKKEMHRQKAKNY